MTTPKLNGYHVIFGRVFTSQNNALKACWKDALSPLASCRQWLGWRDDNKNIVVSLDDSHHTNRAAFFDVPTKPNHNFAA